VTSDPDFKVTTFFDIMYLRNEIESYYYNRTSIGRLSIEWGGMVTFSLTFTDL